MNSTVAKIIVRSMLERLRQDGQTFVLPESRLSATEATALRFLVMNDEPGVEASTTSVDGRSRRSSGLIEESLDSGTAHTGSDADSISGILGKLDLKALNTVGPEEPIMRLCIDFGTAMSKAWAAYRTIDETVPLNLSIAVGDGDKFPVPSAIFISDSGKVFFGEAAERQHRQELNAGRRRFDNIKRILSEAEIDQDLHEVPVDRATDPTDSGVTKGDLLILYLGWLTDHALVALQEQVGAEMGEIDAVDLEKLRSVRRRYAIPCFENALGEEADSSSRSIWANNVLREAIRKAQIVADTFHGKWNDIRLSEDLPIIRAVHTTDLTKLGHLLADRPAIREPVAAGASRFEDKFEEQEMRSTRYLLVIDAGAGTSDFAVFQVVLDPECEEEKFKYALIAPTVKMSRIAGNEIDAVLRPLFFRAVGIDPLNGAPRSASDFSLISTDLESKIRDLKQILFSEKEVEYTLRPNLRGKLQIRHLDEHSPYLKLGEELIKIRNDTVAELFANDSGFLNRVRQLNERTGKAMPISVLLTGGSSFVPIVSNLCTGTFNIDDARFEFEKVMDVPIWVDSFDQEFRDLIAGSYPQCAVAIGGTAPDLPHEVDDLTTAVTPAPEGERMLPRFQTRGI